LDSARRRSGLLIAAGALAAGLTAPSSEPPLRAARWLAPGADKAALLTRRPAECLVVPLAPDEAYAVEVGRAAFRTPLILGGQAARIGIACATCHTNGRANHDLVLPGVSGPPGTADVTSSLFSSHRGDGIDNPKPIPDLAGPKAALKISQAPGAKALEGFIHGLVTQEFDGPEPPPAVLSGLAAYVRALTPAACPKGGGETIAARSDVDDARRAVTAALQALVRRDRATAAVMIGAARSGLGSLAERYATPGLTADLSAIALADMDLAAALSAVRAGDPGVAMRLQAWEGRSHVWAAQLLRDEPRSYYERATLARALGQVSPAA
jgi:hypothetical protein